MKTNTVQYKHQRQTINVLDICITILLEKSTGSQLVKKFPTIFHYHLHDSTPLDTTLSLLNVRVVHNLHTTSLKSILILSYHVRLGLTCGLFLSGFPTKKFACVLHVLTIVSSLIWHPNICRKTKIIRLLIM